MFVETQPIDVGPAEKEFQTNPSLTDAAYSTSQLTEPRLNTSDYNEGAADDASKAQTSSISLVDKEDLLPKDKSFYESRGEVFLEASSNVPTSNYNQNKVEYQKLNHWNKINFVPPLVKINWDNPSKVILNSSVMASVPTPDSGAGLESSHDANTPCRLVHKTFVTNSSTSISAREHQFSTVAMTKRYEVVENCFTYLPSPEGVFNSSKNSILRNTNTVKNVSLEQKLLEERQRKFLFSSLQLVVPVAFEIKETKKRGKPADPIITTTGIIMMTYNQSLNGLVAKHQASLNHTPFVNPKEHEFESDAEKADQKEKYTAEGDEEASDMDDLAVAENSNTQIVPDHTHTKEEKILPNDLQSPKKEETAAELDDSEHSPLPTHYDPNSNTPLMPMGAGADQQSSNTYSLTFRNSSEFLLATPASLGHPLQNSTPLSRGGPYYPGLPQRSVTFTQDSFTQMDCPPEGSTNYLANQLLREPMLRQFDMPPRDSTPCQTPLNTHNMSYGDISTASAPPDLFYQHISGSLSNANTTVSATNSPAMIEQQQRLLGLVVRSSATSTPQVRPRGANSEETLGESLFQQPTAYVEREGSFRSTLEERSNTTSPQQATASRELSLAATGTHNNTLSYIDDISSTEVKRSKKDNGHQETATKRSIPAQLGRMKHSKSTNDMALHESSLTRWLRVQRYFRRGERNEPLQDKKLLVSIIYLIVRGLKQLYFQLGHEAPVLVMPATTDWKKSTDHPLYRKGYFMASENNFDRYLKNAGKVLTPVATSNDPSRPGALYFVPFSGFCHNDLRLANILVDASSGNLLLCDFELTEFVMGEDGTLLDFQNDELKKEMRLSCKTISEGKRISKDGYALGVLIAELITGKEPLFDEIKDNISTKSGSGNTPSSSSGLTAEDILFYLTCRKPNGGRSKDASEGLFCEHLTSFLLHCFKSDPQERWKVTKSSEFHPLFTTVLGGGAPNPDSRNESSTPKGEAAAPSVEIYKDKLLNELCKQGALANACKEAIEDATTNWTALEAAQKHVMAWLKTLSHSSTLN